MAWQIIGQDDVTEQLRKEVETGQVTHAYLFAGLPHLGKLATARRLAGALFCEQGSDPCGACRACVLYAAGNHPDYHELPEADPLKIEQVRQLKHDMALKPHTARWRVGVIPNAERLAGPAQNALLKLLEEPPPHTVLVLTAARADDLLPTTVSRCRMVRFRRPSAEIVQRATGAEPALVDLADGRPGLVRTMQEDEDLVAARQEWQPLLEEVIDGSAAVRLGVAKRLAEREDLPELLEYWQGLHGRALQIEYRAETTEGLATLLAERYTAAQLQHNLAALLAARDALHYNSNVLLTVENGLLKLGR